MAKIKEELLHYIWKTKSFDLDHLVTTSGQQLTILDFGHHNYNSGPDFLHAKLLLDRVMWHGHIEIHVRSSDWQRHRHDCDSNYENVILHVVLEEDRVIKLKDGTRIACLELKPRIRKSMLSKYYKLSKTSSWIPCEKLVTSVSPIAKVASLDKMNADRLTAKSVDIIRELNQLNGDVQSLIYRRLAMAWGFKINSVAMHRLASLVPFKVLRKHKDNLQYLEAILFGSAGLLPQIGESEYESHLMNNYIFLRQKFGFGQMSAVEWKFSKMRPRNFPTIRIAQFAKFIFQVDRIDGFLSSDSFDRFHQDLNVNLSGYWDYHYIFGKTSAVLLKRMGSHSKNSILINGVATVLFALGVYGSDELMKKRALEILENTPSEKNSILNKWNSLGFLNENALDSQGLLHLKKSYCEQYKCLSCPIGHDILSKTS